MAKQDTKIIVGLSGGVDSSVAAYLLLQQGYQVEGLFMKNWEGDDDDEHCSAAQDLADVQAVCAKLSIPLHTVNFSEEYWDNVFKHFLAEYQAGRTPNPDILCNREIKFKAFLDYALAHGADYIATGHYVRCDNNNGPYQLLKGLDPDKDQSYFLYTLGQKALQHSLFPVGELLKSDVRAIAKKQGFINHNKKDSTGICFIGERKFKAFLNEYLLAKPGDIVTTEGEVIGRHDGLMFHTLGQRQGLKIGGLKGKSEIPWYVVDKDIANNQLIVAQGNEHPLLFAQSLIAEQMHWISETKIPDELTCTAKIRYRQDDQPCQLTRMDDEQFKVTFKEKQRAITPGQSVVFYQGPLCLGGGVIRVKSRHLIVTP